MGNKIVLGWSALPVKKACNAGAIAALTIKLPFCNWYEEWQQEYYKVRFFWQQFINEKPDSPLSKLRWKIHPRAILVLMNTEKREGTPRFRPLGLIQIGMKKVTRDPSFLFREQSRLTIPKNFTREQLKLIRVVKSGKTEYWTLGLPKKDIKGIKKSPESNSF